MVSSLFVLTPFSVCKEHYVHRIDRYADKSTCNCDYTTGKCKFDNKGLSSCIAGVCEIDTDYIFSEFELGFYYDPYSADGFHPQFECDGLVPSDNPDSAIAGKPALGSSCHVKCKEGYHFAEHTEATFKMTCINQWDHNVDWDVFHHAWDRYDIFRF